MAWPFNVLFSDWILRKNVRKLLNVILLPLKKFICNFRELLKISQCELAFKWSCRTRVSSLACGVTSAFKLLGTVWGNVMTVEVILFNLTNGLKWMSVKIGQYLLYRTRPPARLPGESPASVYHVYPSKPSPGAELSLLQLPAFFPCDFHMKKSENRHP